MGGRGSGSREEACVFHPHIFTRRSRGAPVAGRPVGVLWGGMGTGNGALKAPVVLGGAGK